MQNDLPEYWKKTVKKELLNSGWPVYEHYEIVEENDEAFVVASVSPASFIESKPMEEGVVQEGEMEGWRWQKYASRDPLKDRMTLYAPLNTPELVVELAKLAEKKITPEDVLGWAQVYGLLASIPSEDTVSTFDGFVNLRVSGWGRRENVRRFAEAAGEIKACLRVYEALITDEDVDLDELSSAAGPLPLEILRQRDRREGEERSWLFILGRMVQARLNEHCYPQFTTYTIGGLAAGKFALSLGFKNLLGAIWLHMAWLLEAESERVRRCKLPGCLRVIHFESGQPPADPGLKKDARGRYKTRVDREFCKGRGCKQKYHYRKKAGWSGYN